MTVEIGYEPTLTDGDGVSRTFPFSFRFDSLTDIRCAVYGVDGVQRTPAFTASGDGLGGAVTISGTAPAAGEKVLISRETLLRQSVNYEAGDFPSSAHERSADRLTLAAQERAAIASRTLRFDPLTGPIDPLPVIEVDRVLMRTATGFRGGPSVIDFESAREFAEAAVVIRDEVAGLTEEARQSALASSRNVVDRAALKALDTVANRNAYLLEEGREGNFIWRAGDFASQVSGDTSEAIYIKADDVAATAGAWVRQYNFTSAATWFSIVVAPDDDTDTLQAAVNDAMREGGQVNLPMDRDLIITRPVVVQIKKNLIPAIGTDIHFDRYNPLRLFSAGRRAIRAAASFVGEPMLYFTFDEPLNRPGPYWSEVANINLDGGGVAQTGIHFEWTIDVRARDLAIYGVDDCLKFTGFGVADINRCVFRSTGKGINFEGGGGDSWVTKCDFFTDFRGVSIGPRGGNTYVEGNIFNRQDDEVAAGAYPIAVFIQGDNTVFDTRDIRIHGNEFAGQDVGVYANSTTGDTDVVRLSIQNNHLNPSQGGGLNTQALCELVRVTNPNICGNRVGSEIYSTPTSFRARPAVNLTDCDGAVVSNNSFNNLRRPALSAVDCFGLSYNGNNHLDVGLESGTSPAVYLENVQHSAVSGNVARQSVSTAGRILIAEAGTSTANKGVGNVTQNYPALASLAGGSTSTYS